MGLGNYEDARDAYNKALEKGGGTNDAASRGLVECEKMLRLSLEEKKETAAESSIPDGVEIANILRSSGPIVKCVILRAEASVSPSEDDVKTPAAVPEATTKSSEEGKEEETSS
eukprot:5951454-Ditylum_brightwellii.AAC.1